MTIQVKRFKWLRTRTAWETAESWRARRSAIAQQFLNDGAAVSAAFANAQTNLSKGMAVLAAQASIDRTQQKIRAAQEQFSAVKNQVNLLA